MPQDAIITRSPRRRRTVALRVLPDGTLTVQAPVRTSMKWIEAFIASRAGWIEKRRAEAAQKEQIDPLVLADGSEIPYLGETLKLAIAEGAYEPAVLASPATALSHRHPAEGRDPESASARHMTHTARGYGPLDSRFRGNDTGKEMDGTLSTFLHLTLPADLSEEARQAEIRTELTLWYKKQARAVFQERMAHWAEVMGVKPARLVLSAPKRQWGSCNPKNEIRLNWRLIMGKAEWLDYVIVHELAHIPHKNHGPRFWKCVERALPDSKKRRKELHDWKGEDWLTN